MINEGMRRNCAGIEAHYEDIKIDQRILKADIIHLVEMSITADDNENEYALEGYEEQFLKVSLGRGIGTYYDREKFKYHAEVKKEKYQIMKFKHKMLDSINIYRSQLGHSLELLEDIKNMIEADRVTVITGDFNICFIENSSNRLIQGLLKMGFDQLVHEPTHIRGRHIDHCYYMDHQNEFEAIMERYSPYYSDHDGLCIALKKRNEES